MSPVDLSLAELLVTAKTVITTLSSHDCMLGISESVTGGAIASCLTRVDGCSKVLFASQVLYSILGKSSFCELPLKDIAEKGTVSEFIIIEMLECMAHRFFKARQDPGIPGIVIAPMNFISLATSGVAGDSIEGQPSGTVLVGISVHRQGGDRIGRHVRKYSFKGDRGEIMLAATRSALALVLEETALLSSA